MPRKAFVYHLDETSANSVRGLVKHNRLSRPIKVSLYHEGKLVGAATAAEYREDVEAAGLGHGHFGFEIVPNVNRASLDPVKIEIFFGRELIETRDITPEHDHTLRGFAQVIEHRVDAMLALTQERMQREFDQKLKQILPSKSKDSPDQ